MADDVNEVWNRACDAMAAGEVPAHDGDRALVAAIALDGAVQSGGLVSAVEQDLAGAGVEAYRWFGLDDLATLVERAADRVQGASGDTSALEQVELEDDPAYYAADTGQRLMDALAVRLREAPEAFAPR